MATQAPSPAAPTNGTLASPNALSPSSNNGSTSGNSTSPPPQIQTPPSVPPASSPPPTSSPPPPPVRSPPTNSKSPPPVSSPPGSSSPPSNSSASPPSSPPPASSPPPSPPAIVSPPPAQSPPPTAAASPPPPKSASPPTSSPPPTTLSPPPSTTKPSTPPIAKPPSKSKSPPPPSSESPPPSPPAASPPLSPPTPIVVSPSPKPSTPESPSPKASPSPPEATSPTSTPPPPATITPGSPPSSKSPPSTGHPPPQSLSPPNSATTTTTESSPSSGGGVSATTVAGITVGVLVVLAFAVVGGLIWCRRKKKKDLYDYYTPPPPGSFSGKSDVIYGSSSSRSDQHLVKPPVAGYGYDNGYKGSRGSADDVVGVPGPQATTSGLGNSKSWFTYEELAIATNGFSPQNVLGEGGFGCVYKGYLQDGKAVAVKQLKRGSGQGEREFRAEVEIISRVHHRHLVSLVGYCIADSQRLLVYDYVPNGTLEYHLHGSGRPVMDWPTRLKIAVGAARGIAYLHEDCHPRIIHRDIKSANILLDDRFEAQVSDFGLAKLALDTNTHVTTRVMGTFGYMAPEYASSGKLTQRSDVFSFGVVLLELLTGRKPVDTSQPLGDESLVEWARPLLSHALEEGGDFEGIVDPRLENNYNQIEMFRMIEAAAACVRHSAQRRPGMGQVVRALESDNAIADLNNGVKPGQSTMYNSAQYSIDIRRFRRMAFGSHEYGSDFSVPSGEYEMTRSTSSSEFHKSKEAEVKHSRQQKRDMDVQSASGSEFPSSESETRPINVSRSHKDEVGERSSGEVPINFGSEPLRGR